jgi:hypothetical protein
MKALYIDGPINSSGKAPPKYLIPLDKSSLFPFFLVLI